MGVAGLFAFLRRWAHGTLDSVHWRLLPPSRAPWAPRRSALLHKPRCSLHLLPPGIIEEPVEHPPAPRAPPGRPARRKYPLILEPCQQQPEEAGEGGEGGEEQEDAAAAASMCDNLYIGDEAGGQLLGGWLLTAAAWPPPTPCTRACQAPPATCNRLRLCTHPPHPQCRLHNCLLNFFRFRPQPHHPRVHAPLLAR